MARSPRRATRRYSRPAAASRRRAPARRSYTRRTARGASGGRTVRIVIENPQMSAMARPGMIAPAQPLAPGEGRLMRTLGLKKAAF